MNQTIAITAIVMFAVSLGVSTMSPVFAAPPETKVLVCHHAADTENWVVISIGSKAADRHLSNHDGDYVMDSLEDNCSAEI